MENINDNVLGKLRAFIIVSLGFCGKMIGLGSNQFFSIEQVCDEHKKSVGEYLYRIQYGFPQSGGVCVNISYSSNDNSIFINDIAVYAVPNSASTVTATVAPELQIEHMEESSIKLNFGIDLGTREYTSLEEIQNNPEALQMIEMAIVDLSRAQVLDDCCVNVPIGSETIPCCISRPISNMR